MKGIPSIWFALLLLGLLTALTTWIEHTVQPSQPKRDGSTRHDPDYTITDFSSSRTDKNGNPRFNLSGQEMRHYPDNDTTDLVKPSYTQYSLKHPETRIEGLRGQISGDGENVFFMDNVKVVRTATASKGELTILTDYLHVMPETEIVETDHPVQILQAPRTVIHANGMHFDKKQGMLTLTKRVKVHYESPDVHGLKPLSIANIGPTKKTNPIHAKSGDKRDSASLSPEKPLVKRVEKSRKTIKPMKNSTGNPRIRRHYEKP